MRTLQAIAPSFAAIKLEDIAAPACFEVEERLCESPDMPVFQDDQQGTASVTLATVIYVSRWRGATYVWCRSAASAWARRG